MSIIKEMTDEFIEKDGYVTCEFSTAKFDANDFNELSKCNEQLAKANRSERWNAHYCVTCLMHDPTAPIHVEIAEIQMPGE